jgi:1-aminocyclopropane-1-carboxylate deaminase/D-cysteine desulfhydrase-like pyridoxal-dependent ACC family enzyme
MLSEDLNERLKDTGLLFIPDIKKIVELNKLILGKWPTPLMECNLTNHFYIKRDDLSGFGRGGIKTRKLETFVAYVRSYGYTDIVIIVPNISNLRADFEELAQNLDINIHLVVANDPFLKDGIRKSFPFNEKIKYTVVGKSKLSVSFHFLMVYLKLIIRKKKAGLFFPSLSHPASVIGAAGGMVELLLQLKERAVIENTTHVFISGCTGSSAAGLILAGAILRGKKIADFNIHVVKVFPLPLKLWILFMLWWTKSRYSFSVKIRPSDICIEKKYTKLPYGKSDIVLENICSKIHEDFNMNIDPVYGARTWSVMQDFINNPSFTSCDNNVVFWNCGYTKEWELFK